MSSERVPSPASVWEFQPTDDLTDNDLIQITYENDTSIYLVIKDNCWIVDPSLMPNDLRDILTRYNSHELRLQRKTLNDTMSGHVGHPLTLRLSSESGMYGRDVICTSIYNVKAISTIPRSDIDENPLSYRSHSHLGWLA